MNEKEFENMKKTLGIGMLSWNDYKRMKEYERELQKLKKFERKK